jgi:hypothetical protein
MPAAAAQATLTSPDSSQMLYSLSKVKAQLNLCSKLLCCACNSMVPCHSNPTSDMTLGYNATHRLSDYHALHTTSSHTVARIVVTPAYYFCLWRLGLLLLSGPWARLPVPPLRPVTATPAAAVAAAADAVATPLVATCLRALPLGPAPAVTPAAAAGGADAVATPLPACLPVLRLGPAPAATPAAAAGAGAVASPLPETCLRGSAPLLRLMPPAR